MYCCGQYTERCDTYSLAQYIPSRHLCTYPSSHFTMPRCEAKKKDGKRCTKTVGQGVHFCPVHQKQTGEVGEMMHEEASLEAFEEALEEIMSDITAEAVALDVSLPFPNPLFDSPTSTNEDDSTTVTDGLKAQNLELQGLLTSQQNELTALLNKYNDQSINMETLQMENAKLLDCIKTLKKENLLLLDAQQQTATMATIAVNTEEIETLKEKIKLLEEENKALKTVKPKGKRQPKDIQYLAKFVYYHKLKTDANLVQEVKEKLVKADVNLKKTVKGKEQDVIPWMIVKQITDELYAGLDPAAKKAVLDETKAKYNLE